MNKIEVLLVDARPAARQGLKAVLAVDAGIQVIGEAADEQQARKLARKRPPDAVVVGVADPLIKSLKAIQRILASVPSAKVLVLASLKEQAWSGHLESKLGNLRLLIKQVTLGSPSENVVQPTLAAGRPRWSRAGQSDVKSPHLTAREQEVLRLIAHGLSNKQIAAELGLSIKTVEKHRQQVMDKLNIHGIAGLTRYAIFGGMYT